MRVSGDELAKEVADRDQVASRAILGISGDEPAKEVAKCASAEIARLPIPFPMHGYAR